jgi:hypothetical protein
VIPASDDAIAVDLDNGVASLRMDNVPVTDAHDLLNNLTGGHGFANPPIPPVAPVPAAVSFDIEWSGIISSARIVNETQNFRGNFVQTGGTISWSANQAGFTFTSEPPNPARNFYSVIGHEQNGVFFHPEGND